MHIELNYKECKIRSWRMEDLASLTHHANNRNVWKNLRDQFPHPYTHADAQQWLGYAPNALPETQFAIEVSGEAAGGIGFILGSDVNRCAAEIGYWLGEACWGKGIASAAVYYMTRHAVKAFNLTRVFATPFSDNVASFRVLEKSGFQREGLMRRSAIKDGKVIDQVLYAYTLE